MIDIGVIEKALLKLRVDFIPSDGSLEPRNRGNSGSRVFIHLRHPR